MMTYHHHHRCSISLFVADPVMSGGTRQPPATGPRDQRHAVLPAFGLAISPSAAMELINIPGTISTVDDGVVIISSSLQARECMEQIIGIMEASLANLSGQFEDAEEPGQGTA